MDFLDFCCPSKSRSVVDLDDIHSHKNEDEGTSRIGVSMTHDSESDERVEGQNEDTPSVAVKNLMDKLMGFRDELRKIPDLSAEEKSRLNVMLLLLRGEVSNVRIKDRNINKFKLNLPKSLPRFRFEKSVKKKNKNTWIHE